jgi:ubiquinone/menaquinone biosynthesis C-methylase UbiE
MVNFSRNAYRRHYNKKINNNEEASRGNLVSDELWLWDRIPNQKGNVLILGVGDGREAIFFGQQGLTATGLDFCEEAIEKADRHMNDRGFKFKGITGEISRLNLPNETFDITWISMFLYSVVLGRSNRINMLKNIRSSLKS